jgi:hypothetical protein
MRIATRGRVRVRAEHGFSPQRPGLAPRADRVGFVVVKVALGQVYLQVCLFSPVNINPTLFHIHSYVIGGIHNALLAAVASEI